jgi:hypothetical protein
VYGVTFDRHVREIRSKLRAVWIAPVGTQFPDAGEYVDEPWELLDPASEVPDVPPEDGQA